MSGTSKIKECFIVGVLWGIIKLGLNTPTETCGLKIRVARLAQKFKLNRESARQNSNSNSYIANPKPAQLFC
jgi:hypothetical protein